MTHCTCIYYVRMKRSVLNINFFPKHRMNTLKSTFQSWVRFFLWNRGHKDAYQLKYEILKRKLDIHAQFKQQLQYTRDDKKSTKSDQNEDQKDEIPTIMHRSRQHPVLCKQCRTYYLEGTNNSTACRYHPGEVLFCLVCISTLHSSYSV
jgi:hypothetical protein